MAKVDLTNRCPPVPSCGDPCVNDPRLANASYIPTTDCTIDLGAASFGWNNIYACNGFIGNITADVGNFTTINGTMADFVTVNTENLNVTNLATINEADITLATIGTETVTQSTITTADITTANIDTANITTENVTTSTINSATIAAGFLTTADIGTAVIDALTVTGGLLVLTDPALNLISTGTLDGADNKSLTIAGGGTQGSSRGSSLTVSGNEEPGFLGSSVWGGGNVATAHLIVRLINASTQFLVQSGTNTLWTIDTSGDLSASAANGGYIFLYKPGTTLGIKGGGANRKAGTFTLNGATPVSVANTSVTANSVIVSSLKTVGGTVGQTPSVKTLTAGVGFDVAGTAGDTSDYTYIIFELI